MVNKFTKSTTGKLTRGGKTIQQITAWSYSRYAKWKECPMSAKAKFIDKMPEKQSPAMARGEAIHKLAENYAKGELKKLPSELSKFEPQFKELKKSKPVVEEMWCFTKDWAETKWNDWNGIWLRVKTDAAALDGTDLYVIDHKTGQNRGGYKDQMNLSALAGMLKFPFVKNVITQLWFLDSGDIVESEFSAKDAPKMQKDWEKKVTPMMKDTNFPPKPGNHCKWCPLSKAKGGPCKY